MGKYKFIEERVETMSLSELKIFLNILKSRSKELMSTLESVRGIKDLEAVCKSTQKLNNRVSEFDGGSFLILVVGPVKSGKSTLVNLIAHAHVSPTHFLECTVRPSIISKGQEESITRIFSVADKARKVEQFDSVIDSLRGFEKLENISEISIEKKELNDANLEECVSLALEESVINTDHTLVTSITTSGGELLKDNIFLVDMPGLDGGYANLDNPIYETISQRADFVIFVQSSNSAISKVSNRFLKLLQENNPKVPVCLLHNVFEAAYWHSEEEKQAVIKAQTPDTYTASFEVPYEPGQLKACIVKGKKETASAELNTTGSPASIRLTADRSKIKADKNDLSYVKIEVLDKNGRVIPDCDLPLEIKSSGKGSVIASGNGSADDMRSFRSLTPKAFRGKAIAIVQPDMQAGNIHLTVSAKGLPEANITIETY